MEISLLLMEEIAKLFAIMLMGYAVVKAGLMKSSESKSVSVIMVYLVIPCVIINAFQVKYTPDVQKGLILACVAAVAVHILFLILTALLKNILHLDAIERATVIYSNAGILVIPLVQELLGQEYVIYSSAYIAVQLILIWTHCKNMLCEEDKLEWKKVLLNVNIISIIVGVVLFIGRIQLPSGVQDVMNMMKTYCISDICIVPDENNLCIYRNNGCKTDSPDRVSGICNTCLCDCHLHGTALR